MSFVRLCRLFHMCITRLLWFTYVLYVYIIQNGDYSERPRLVCYWLCKISCRRNTILCFHGTYSLFQAFRKWSAALNRARKIELNKDERRREREKTAVGGVGGEREGITYPTPGLFFWPRLFVPSRNLKAWNRLSKIKLSQYTYISFIFAETTLGNQNLRYVITWLHTRAFKYNVSVLVTCLECEGVKCTYFNFTWWQWKRSLFKNVEIRRQVWSTPHLRTHLTNRNWKPSESDLCTMYTCSCSKILNERIDKHPCLC